MDEIKKTIKELNLEDDFLFAKVMSDENICKKVLEQILGISIKKVEALQTQKTIDLLLEGKGIRLDVYVNDEKGTIYNVEMQRAKKKDLPKRTRYYQGSIDLDLINAGNHYSELRKSYIIFICTFDFFEDGRHIYTFENVCLENPDIRLKDETIKLFLNTRGSRDDISSDMKEFLEYVENTTEEYASHASSRLVKELQKKVESVKASREMEVEYMTLLERDRENREIGMQEGMQKGVFFTSSILKLYSKGKNKNEIAKDLNLDLKMVSEIIDNYERA